MAKEIKIWEKSEGELRIDHPDFRDVYETTYKKGIIRDFEIISEKPIILSSMVKVEIDGQLYPEFIPLFYKPRAKHWDTAEAKATDFDTEKGCYKNAWMSFRIGDEVVVLLKKGVPKAVIGHYDNIPRLGANVFRHEADVHPDYYEPSLPHIKHVYSYFCAFGTPGKHERLKRFDDYDLDYEIDFHVNQEFDWEIALEKLCAKEEYKDGGKRLIEVTPVADLWSGPRAAAEWHCYGYGCNPPSNPPQNLNPGHYDEIAYIYVRYRNYDEVFMHTYFFRVGPVLYAIEQEYIITHYLTEIYITYFEEHCGDMEHYVDIQYPHISLQYWQLILINQYSGTFKLPYTGGTLTWDLSKEAVGELGWKKTYRLHLSRVYAALCTPELWENPDTSKMILQDDYFGCYFEQYFVLDADSYKFQVPPHDKDDLVAAGLALPSGPEQGE